MKKLVLVDGNGLACETWWGSAADVPRRFSAVLADAGDSGAEVVVAWDAGTSWRKVLMPSYKANRPPKPEALLQALRDCRKVSATHVWAEGYEADDVIATLARSANGARVVIISRDKDYAQLVGPTCFVIERSGKVYDAAAVEAKFGVPPNRIRHLLSWAGDATDGLPGVRGYGPKKSVEKALAGEVGDPLTFDLVELVEVPKHLIRRVQC